MLLLRLRLTIQNRILKILYISFFYPPFNTIGGSRAYGQVQAFISSGSEVHVITSADQNFELSNDFEFPNNHKVFYKGKNIVFNRGIINEKVISQKKKLSSFKSFLIRVTPKIFIRAFMLISSIFRGYEEFPYWSKKVLEDYQNDIQGWKPDIIFSSYSPIDSHILASKISKELEVPWVAEYRDCWSFNTMGFSENQNDLWSLFLRRKESKILAGCQLILAATPFIKEYYQKFFDKNVELLLGGWEEVTKVSTSLVENADSRLEILHLGSMLHGTRSIEPIIELLEKFPELKKSYHFSFVGRDTNLFVDKVKNSSLSKSISLSGHVTFNQSEKLGQSTDILLILMKNTPMEKYTLTGKIFEYIKFQKPIICIDPFESEVSNFIKNFKMGYVVKSANELASLLKRKGSINNFIRISDENRLKFKRSEQISNILNTLPSTFRDFDNH